MLRQRVELGSVKKNEVSMFENKPPDRDCYKQTTKVSLYAKV